MRIMSVSRISYNCLVLLLIDFALSLECKKSEKNTIRETVKHECERTCEYPPKPTVCEYQFTASWTYTMSAYCFDCPWIQEDCLRDRCMSVDGTCRPVVTINKMSPGPSIEVCEGDTIRVKVINKLQDDGGLSIHWHGMNQNRTNIMDGVSMITQCPIARGTSFVYKFIADPPGTHWWHSHSGIQRGDGMYGSLIVRAPKETEVNGGEYDFDLSEHVMIVNDWTSNMIMENFALGVDHTRTPNSHTLSLLVNGMGRNVEFTDANDTVYYTPRAEFEVEKGKRYRMRMINTAFGECNLHVAFQSHKLNIIGSDGHEFKTVKQVDSFVISPGERLDFVLTANAMPSTYCISLLGYPESECNSSGEAILRYKQAPNIETQCTYDNKSLNRTFSTLKDSHVERVLDGIQYVSLSDTFALEPVPSELYNVDEKYYIVIDEYAQKLHKQPHDETGIVALVLQMDGAEFKFPETPLLTAKASFIETCHPTQNRSAYESCISQLCQCTNVLKVQLGQVIELVLLNNVNLVPHPMHLHGQSFRVLAQESIGAISIQKLERLDDQGELKRIDLDKAVVKDTVNVPQYGYAIIRWKAENPGYWFFHCHVNYHSEFGMTMVIQIGDDEEIPRPPDNYPTCGSWSPD
ncbi:laccase-15-like isoform X2 [Anneissia japonica]|uniref:laccase-15-like isoform X2 n=1 Tax=Anneissia japonica TaxID=1529436 RepID=UPI0014256FD0|nr:laccase-15-like isoform X2 [Anneissia japonica]